MKEDTVKMLKFGGPGLPEGTHTFYETRKPNGDPGFVDRVEPGHVVEAAKVLRCASDPKDDVATADEYVARGQAVYVEMKDPAAVPAPKTTPQS